MSSDIFGPNSLGGGLDDFLSSDAKISKNTSPKSGLAFVNELSRAAAVVFEEQAAAFSTGSITSSIIDNNADVSEYYRPEQASARLLEVITSLSGGDASEKSVEKGLNGAVKQVEQMYGSVPKATYETLKQAVEKIKSEEEG